MNGFLGGIIANFIADFILGLMVWFYRANVKNLQKQLKDLIGASGDPIDGPTRDLVKRAVFEAAQAQAAANRCEQKIDTLMLALKGEPHV